ncbi:hypothetical protein PCE1_001863 [Barthelona sp. PCE]
MSKAKEIKCNYQLKSLIQLLAPKLSISSLFKLRCVSKKVAVAVEEHMYSLEKLNPFRLETNSLLYAVNYYPNLKYFTSPLDDFMNDEDVIRLASICPNLEFVDLSRTTATFVGIRYLVQNCPNIQHITLTDGINITDGVIGVIAEGATNLTGLNVTNCDYLTDLSLTMLVQYRSDSLHKLVIDGCTKITDVGLAAFCEGNPDVEILSVARTSLTEVGIKSIIANCEMIEKLNLNSLAVDDNTVSMIVKNCRTIHRIGLGYTGVTPSIVDVLQTLPLHSVDLSGQELLSDDHLEKLLRKCDIERLSVKNCTSLTDRTLSNLVEHCSGMTILTLGPNALFTNDAFLTFARGCMNLKEVELFGLSQIEDTFIEELLKNPNLKSLSLCQCSGVSSAIFPAVTKSKLRFLSFDDSKCVSESEIEQFFESQRSATLKRRRSIIDIIPQPLEME